MTLVRRCVLTIVFVLISQIIPDSAASLPFAAAQSSPTETPVPVYSIQISHIEGALIKSIHDSKGSDIGKMTPVQGIFNDCENDSSLNCNLSDLLSGDSSVVQTWCERPQNQALCSSSGLTASTGWNLGLETVREGDTLSAGNEIYTGDESGVVLEFGGAGSDNPTTIGSATSGAGGGKMVLSQHTALNIEMLGGTADAPDIHLRLDTGLLATMPGGTLPPGANFEIALTDASPDDTQQSSRPTRVKVVWGTLPVVMVGHDPESGDAVVSVLDGTATFASADKSVDIPAGRQFSTHIYYCPKPSAGAAPCSAQLMSEFNQAETLASSRPAQMTDQDWAVWVSALYFGGSDPSSFLILTHHVTDGEPEPFPVYALVHDQAGDAVSGEHHAVFAPSHTSSTDHHTEDTHTQADDTHTTADHATEEAHVTPTDHHDATDTSHTTDGGHTDTGSYDTGTQDTGSHDSGSRDHVEPTEQSHG